MTTATIDQLLPANVHVLAANALGQKFWEKEKFDQNRLKESIVSSLGGFKDESVDDARLWWVQRTGRDETSGRLIDGAVPPTR